jgi:hypothetical protein
MFSREAKEKKKYSSIQRNESLQILASHRQKG